MGVDRGLGMDAPQFREGDSVFLRSTRDPGRIAGPAVPDGGEYWYRVRFAARTENVPEGELELETPEDVSIEQLVLAGRWGRLEAFRRAMALERIEHENRSTIYSYRSQRILFQPHQYKPLLRVLDSLDRRLLIADEVGLGKTIEAGIILAELDARRSLQKVLIVCPSRLREKWRNELNRKFGQDFDVLDRAALMTFARRAAETPEKARLRGIVSVQTLRAPDLLEEFGAQAAPIDLVVVDEAHHARNPSTQTSELLRELGRLGDAVLLLTATPVHLGMRDVHTLLHALRPREFPDATVFEAELERHRDVLAAEAVLRTRETAAPAQAAALLRSVFLDGVLSSLHDPLAVETIRQLEESRPQEAREWVSLERRVQDLHPLAHVVTRSRKRDVQEHAPVRRASVRTCAFSEEESRAYQALVHGSNAQGWFQGPVSLGTIQRARQAASCLPAALAARSRAVSDEDQAVEVSDVAPEDVAGILRRGNDPPEKEGVPLAKPARDSKYELLLEILAHIDKQDPGAKVLIFAFFVGTTRYLAERLPQDGYPAVRIAGDVLSDPLNPDRDERGRRTRQFRQAKEIRILVSSEVGSEGLDFQFAHHVVNYDLPWNPMVVEQRIGRVDRFGQKSPVVWIWNLVVEGTVEDRILRRLYERIGIFKRSIGELEVILGETMRELRHEYFTGRLSPAEADRRVEEATRAIEAKKLDLQVLESRAAELLGHEDFIREEMRRVDRLGRFVSHRAILSLLRGFLTARHPEIGLFREAEGSDGVWGVRLTVALVRDMLLASAGSSEALRYAAGDTLWFTTDGAVAFEREELDLVNVAHPLFRAAVAAMGEQLKAPSARVGQATLALAGDGDSELVAGLYFLAVYALEVRGIRARRVLETVAWRVGSREVIDAESAERLLHLVTDAGEEWPAAARAPAMEPSIYAAVLSAARARYRVVREREQNENEARYLRRRRALVAEFEHRRDVVMRRLQTARERGQEERIQKLFQAQLTKLEAEHEQKLRDLEERRTTSLTLSDPLAVCALKVTRG